MGALNMTLDATPDNYEPYPLDAQRRRHSDGDAGQQKLSVSTCTHRCVETKQEPKVDALATDFQPSGPPFRRSLSQGALEEQLDAPSIHLDPTASERVVEIVDNFFYVFFK